MLFRMYQVFSSLQGHLHFFAFFFSSLLWNTFLLSSLYHIINFASFVAGCVGCLKICIVRHPNALNGRVSPNFFREIGFSMAARRFVLVCSSVGSSVLYFIYFRRSSLSVCLSVCLFWVINAYGYQFGLLEMDYHMVSLSRGFDFFCIRSSRLLKVGDKFGWEFV